MFKSLFNNKILGDHYIVKERPPYKKDFDDADICIVGNIRIDENNERQLYTPSFTIVESYLKDAKSVQLVDDVKEGSRKFHSIDFRHYDLGGAKLDGGDFSSSTFDEANMLGVKLKGANLRGASLKGADLRGADLSNANLEGADLRYCNLEGAKLDGANLSGAKIDGAFFKAAKLTNIKADKKTLSELEQLMQMLDDLATGKLNIKDIPKEWLSFIDLTKIDLNGMDLTGFDLRLLNTVGVDLSSATLTPDQIDGSYMFKSGATSEGFVKVAKHNTAGLDLTSANLINEEIEDEKRKKHLRQVIHKRAKEEALEVIEIQQQVLKHKQKNSKSGDSYLTQRPERKVFLSLDEYNGIDLEEKILTMDKNRMINPENEWDIPRSNSMVNHAIDELITNDLMSDIKTEDYGYRYEKELEARNLEQQRTKDLKEAEKNNQELENNELIEQEKAQEELSARLEEEKRLKEEEEKQQLASDTDYEKETTEENIDLTDLVSKKTRQHLKLNIRGLRQHNKN